MHRLTLLLCIRSICGVSVAPDQDGKSRGVCLIRSSALKGHAPRQTYTPPIRSLVHLLSLADSYVSLLLGVNYAAFSTWGLYRSPLVNTAHAIRANLLAIATPATLA